MSVLVHTIGDTRIKNIQGTCIWHKHKTSLMNRWSPKTAINTLRPRHNGCHFADDILKGIFLNENAWMSIRISLKSVHMGPINNIPSLVQIMAWCRPGDKPLSERWLDYRRIYASVGLNELMTFWNYLTTRPLRWFMLSWDRNAKVNVEAIVAQLCSFRRMPSQWRNHNNHFIPP